jgi:hypothetical protein
MIKKPRRITFGAGCLSIGGQGLYQHRECDSLSVIP